MKRLLTLTLSLGLASAAFAHAPEGVVHQAFQWPAGHRADPGRGPFGMGNRSGRLPHSPSRSASTAKATPPTDFSDLNSEVIVGWSESENKLYVMSPFVILTFGLCSTLFAWDFGMMLIAHWHSTVFPIFFSFGNLFAATAALMFLVAVLGRSEVTGSLFGPDQIRCLGMLVTGFTVLWLYFFWAQFFVVWFGNLPRETDALWPQMYGHYAPYYWTMMFGCFFVPFAALIFAWVKRSAPP